MNFNSIGSKTQKPGWINISLLSTDKKILTEMRDEMGIRYGTLNLHSLVMEAPAGYCNKKLFF